MSGKVCHIQTLSRWQAVLLKLIYWFRTTLTEVPDDFFAEIENPILKFILKKSIIYWRTHTSQFLNLKLQNYSKKKAMWDWIRIDTNQWNRNQEQILTYMITSKKLESRIYKEMVTVLVAQLCPTLCNPHGL